MKFYKNLNLVVCLVFFLFLNNAGFFSQDFQVKSSFWISDVAFSGGSAPIENRELNVDYQFQSEHNKALPILKKDVSCWVALPHTRSFSVGHFKFSSPHRVNLTYQSVFFT
jgi:hypothetical protein